jgi:hypothetical protein
MTEDEMWAALVERWLPEDPDRPNADYETYYRWKYRIAKAIQPVAKSLFEIGVRAGYSAFAFQAAIPGLEYLGWDNDAGQYGGVKGFSNRFIAEGCVDRVDSQTRDFLPRSFDVAHIDGDHSYAGALHDIQLCAPFCRYVLVDDYDFITPVKAATDHFIVSHQGRVRYQHYADGGFRGTMLLDCSKLQVGR